MKKKLAFVLSLALILGVFPSCGAVNQPEQNASETECFAKIAFLVSDAENETIGDTDPLYQYDFIPAKDVETLNFCDYDAVALKDDLMSNSVIAEAVADAYRDTEIKVYVYGEVTLSEYKDLLGIQSIGEYKDIIYSDGTVGKKYVYLDAADDEGEETLNVVQYSDAGSLFASVMVEQDTVFQQIVYDHFVETTPVMSSYATVIEKEYSFKSYYNSKNYVNMDYWLFQETDEIDPDYDFYAVKTIFTMVGDDPRSLDVYKGMVYSADELDPCEPVSATSLSSLNVSVGWSGNSTGSSASASIGLSWNLSQKVDIDHTYSAVNDEATWSITPSSFKRGWPKEAISLLAPWSAGSGVGAINVSFSGDFMVVEDGYDSLVTSKEKTVRIRYY